MEDTIRPVVPCFFVSDLHGSVDRYNSLLKMILDERPSAVFIGGDILPSHLARLGTDENEYPDFINDFLIPRFEATRMALGTQYPRVFLIMGNDDPRSGESDILAGAELGIWTYMHNQMVPFGPYTVLGYSYVPPTPFLLKDWERYDVSRYADPGCLHPHEGRLSVDVSPSELKYATIVDDLQQLTQGQDLSKAVVLFHTPPYDCSLDRCALDGKMIDHAPLDVHVGSVAVRRFIDERQPLVTLHGHIHESVRLTGSWRELFGRTHAFSAAHDGHELALVRFDPGNPAGASRELV